MKKFILLFFILLTYPLFSEKIIITSSYFSNKTDLKEFINNKLSSKTKLKNSINKYLYLKGYVFTKAAKIIFNHEQDTIIIHLDEGRIKQIKVTGRYKISDRIINTYCYFQKGDIFNKKIFQLQIKKLYNTKLFDTIKYEINELKRTILVTVIEKKRIYFEINGDYTKQYGVMPYFGIINRSFFKRKIYLTLNTEFGFWERLNYYQINMDLIIRKIYLKLGHRSGKTFILDKDYSSCHEKIHIGRNLYSDRFYKFIIIFPFEQYNFSNIKNFFDETIINGWRYGIAFSFSYNNKRIVLDIREESFFNLYYNTMIFNQNDNYTKIKTDIKLYQKLFYDFGFIYKNSSGYIWGTPPFDNLFILGGINQRGYLEGAFITDFKFENTFEFENKLIFNFLRLGLFIDTSYFKQDSRYDFIISYGPGIILNLNILNIHNFNIQFFYGVSIKRQFHEGNFYINLKKIIY